MVNREILCQSTALTNTLYHTTCYLVTFYPFSTLFFPSCVQHFYRPQRSWVKVIFLQASVCPRGGGVSASVHAGICPLKQTPPPSRHPPPRADPLDQAPTPPLEQTPPPLWSRHPRTRHPPGPGTPPEQRTPPGSRLHHTVNERPVRILLECILVW